MSWLPFRSYYLNIIHPFLDPFWSLPTHFDISVTPYFMFAGRLDGTGAQWSAPINPQDLISLMIGTKADVSTVLFPFALITVSIRTSILGYHLMSIFQIQSISSRLIWPILLDERFHWMCCLNLQMSFN